MKLPDWLRAGKTTTGAGAITVEFTADTLAYREHLATAQYRAELDHQRLRGRAYVGALLDRLCAEVGLDPVTVWREPRAAEQAWARDLAQYGALERARLQLVGPQPVRSCWGEA